MKKSHYNISLPLISLARTLLPGVAKFPSDFLFFNSGRSTIKWLLSELKKTSGHKLKVGMPCYNCYTVYQAALESGNEIVLLDVDPLNFSLTGKLKSRLRDLDVIIWINYFGFRYSGVIKEIRTRYPGLIIVEDCSHVDLRDYLKIPETELHSDHYIFSFNFGKPVTTGGGGLLVSGRFPDANTANLIKSDYPALQIETLKVKDMVRRIKNNFSFIYTIFLYFKERNIQRTQHPFRPEQLPIRCMAMNEIIKKLVYSQFSRRTDKRRAEKCTLNYFGNDITLKKKYSFGFLSYYPVSLPSDAEDIDTGNTKFLLWKNLEEHYSYFGIEVREDEFPLTHRFISETAMFPSGFFRTNRTGRLHFPVGRISPAP